MVAKRSSDNFSLRIRNGVVTYGGRLKIGRLRRVRRIVFGLLAGLFGISCTLVHWSDPILLRILENAGFRGGKEGSLGKGWGAGGDGKNAWSLPKAQDEPLWGEGFGLRYILWEVRKE